MNNDRLLAAPCGLFCGDCEILGERCAGCGHVQGKPFWTAEYKVEVCPLYGCAVNQHGVEHCGLCAEFPCEMFLSMRDPSMTDEQAEASLERKKADLIQRREIGTEAWLSGRSS